MGLVAAAAYGLVGLLLLVGGATLFAAESMDGVPLYDETAAADPAALARVLGVSLAVFGVATVALAALEATTSTGVVVVAGYAVVVLSTALLTAWQAQRYE